MGHKVHPRGFRIGELYGWSSRWFAKKDYAALLQQDLEMKKFLRGELKEAAVADIEIERTPSATTIIIHSGKPGIIIGRGGQGAEELKKKIKLLYLDKKTSLNINIQEVTNPNMSAELVCQAMISDIEKRFPFRRVMKQAIGRVEKTGAKGVK
jgi:small subunit ribosomal protein S3